MPTPSETIVETKETLTMVPAENRSSEKSQESLSAADPDAANIYDNGIKKKQQQQPHQQSFNGRKYGNRSVNGNQNGNRQNRNNMINKRSNGETNNNANNTNSSNNNGTKQFNYKPASVPQPKIVQHEYQQHHKILNGHVDASKKPCNKFRSITKSTQVGYSYDDNSHNSPPIESPVSISPVFDTMSSTGDPRPSQAQQSTPDGEQISRKYTIDFLHQVGYKMGSVPIAMPQQSPKNQKQIDDLLAVKMAFGDNSDYYSHFYAGSMYSNQMMLQQQQIQQQNYSRYQQSHQQQQQQIQRLQRMYQRGQPENYTRMYQTSMYHEPEQLSCQCPQNAQMQIQRGYQQNYTNSPSFQNRNKNDRRENRDTTNKKSRQGYNQYGYYYQNGNSDRGFKKDHNNRNGNLGKSQSFTEDDNHKRHNQAFINNGDEPAFRSLSPTPPSSSKSSSPGAVDKSIEKDVLRATSSNYELADDSASTASASSSGPSGPSSYVSDMKISLSAPILMAPEEPTKNVNTWIDDNFGGSLHSGLSVSAEHINLKYRDTPITIIKRPPSSMGSSKMPADVHQIPRNINTTYDLQYPFDFYLSRSHEAVVDLPPGSLRCSSKWDQLSEDMWDKFQVHQQARTTYRTKMNLWRDLYNSVKNFPLFHQKAFPKWGLYLVGSTISGFGSDSSDIDMCLVSKGNFTDSRIDTRMEATVTLNDLKNFLMNNMSPFQSFSLINAKVPILRFRDLTNTIEIDLNFNNSVGVRNTHLLYSYSQLDWRLRPLALTVKLWAQFHNINDARNSTISSYSLVLMVIHFLQYAVKPAILPCLHNLCPEKFRVLHDITTIDMVEKCDVQWKSENRQPLGELFCRFLDYYSNFDYSKHAISVRTGGVLPIEECKAVRSLKNDPNHWLTLCIEEPFDLTNTARSAYDSEIFLKIKDVFFNSYYRLNETCDLHSVFKDPFFTNQQQQYMNQASQMKFMMPNGSGTPVMAPLNDCKS